MYDYLCSLCGIRYSKEYSVILTKENKWHCVYCVLEKIDNIGYHIPERFQKIQEIENDYAEDINVKLVAHRLSS